MFYEVSVMIRHDVCAMIAGVVNSS